MTWVKEPGTAIGNLSVGIKVLGLAFMDSSLVLMDPNQGASDLKVGARYPSMVVETELGLWGLKPNPMDSGSGALMTWAWK